MTPDDSRCTDCPCPGEHRPLGQRDWCHDCTEYCYGTNIPCLGGGRQLLLDFFRAGRKSF